MLWMACSEHAFESIAEIPSSRKFCGRHQKPGMENNNQSFERSFENLETAGAGRHVVGMGNVSQPLKHQPSNIGPECKFKVTRNSDRKATDLIQNAEGMCDFSMQNETKMHFGHNSVRCPWVSESNLKFRENVATGLASFQVPNYGSVLSAPRVVKSSIHPGSWNGRAALQSAWIQRLIPASDSTQTERMKSTALPSGVNHHPISLHNHGQEAVDVSANEPRGRLESGRQVYENSRSSFLCTNDLKGKPICGLQPARDHKDNDHKIRGKSIASDFTVSPVSLPLVKSLLLGPSRKSDEKALPWNDSSACVTMCRGQPLPGHSCDRKPTGSFSFEKEPFGSNMSVKKPAMQGMSSKQASGKVVMGFGSLQVTLERPKLPPLRVDSLQTLPAQHSFEKVGPPSSASSFFQEHWTSPNTHTQVSGLRSVAKAVVGPRQVYARTDGGEVDKDNVDGISQPNLHALHKAKRVCVEKIASREEPGNGAFIMSSHEGLRNNTPMKVWGSSGDSAKPLKIISDRSLPPLFGTRNHTKVEAAQRPVIAAFSSKSHETKEKIGCNGTQTFSTSAGFNEQGQQLSLGAVHKFWTSEGDLNVDCRMHHMAGVPLLENAGVAVVKGSPQCAIRREVDYAVAAATGSSWADVKEPHDEHASHLNATVASFSFKVDSFLQNKRCGDGTSTGEYQHFQALGLEEEALPSQSTSKTASLSVEECAGMIQQQGNAKNANFSPKIYSKPVEEKDGRSSEKLKKLSTSSFDTDVLGEGTSYYSIHPWPTENVSHEASSMEFRSASHFKSKYWEVGDCSRGGKRHICSTEQGNLTSNSMKGTADSFKPKDYVSILQAKDQQSMGGFVDSKVNNISNKHSVLQASVCVNKHPSSSLTGSQNRGNGCQSVPRETNICERPPQMLCDPIPPASAAESQEKACGFHLGSYCAMDDRCLRVNNAGGPHDLYASVESLGSKEIYADSRKVKEGHGGITTSILGKRGAGFLGETEGSLPRENQSGFSQAKQRSLLGSNRDEEFGSKRQMWLHHWRSSVPVTQERPLLNGNLRKTLQSSATRRFRPKTTTPVSRFMDCENLDDQQRIAEPIDDVNGYTLASKSFTNSQAVERGLQKSQREFHVTKHFFSPSAAAMAVMGNTARQVQETQPERKGLFGVWPSVREASEPESHKELDENVPGFKKKLGHGVPELPVVHI